MSNEQPTQKESLPEINWVRPNIQSEMGEIERITKMVSGSDDHSDRHYQEVLQEIIQAMETASFEELTDEMWSILENTDSYHNVRPGYMEDAQKLALKYNRDWKTLLDALQHNTPIQAPIILIQKDSVPHLVAGNTRLIIARALGAKAHALIARLKDPEES